MRRASMRRSKPLVVMAWCCGTARTVLAIVELCAMLPPITRLCVADDARCRVAASDGSVERDCDWYAIVALAHSLTHKSCDELLSRPILPSKLKSPREAIERGTAHRC